MERTDEICRKLFQTISGFIVMVRSVCVSVESTQCLSVCVCLTTDFSVSVLSPGQEVLQTLRSCSAPSVEELKTQESQLSQEDSRCIFVFFYIRSECLNLGFVC